MTVWCKLENEEVYAVAIYNFRARVDSKQLSLDVGELVHILGETADWYWGQSLRQDATGAFPKTYVLVRDCVVVDRSGETVVASAGGQGFVHDIAVTLREWLGHCKKLYVNNDRKSFELMEMSMKYLRELRKQAASGAFTQDELRRIARTAVFTIDKGNRELGMELSVRTANCQLVDPLKISTYKLNALHDEANERISKNKNMDLKPTSASPCGGLARTCTFAVRVHDFVCRMSEPAELALALYDASAGKLTEHLLLRWPGASPTTTPQVIFTDFGSDILKSEKIYLVCNIVRIGNMEAQNIDHRRSSVAAPLQAGVGVGAGAGRALRRPLGVACADVKRYVSKEHCADDHIKVPFYAYEKENLDSLLKKVIANRDIKDAKYSQGLWVSIQVVEGDLKQIREENAQIVMGNTVVARKMGFPEVILPGDARNDLYVTLCSGSFSKGGGKSSERNIELIARVVDKNGRILDNVVSVGAGLPLTQEYTSTVYYHDDRPRWQETFKVCLSIEVFKEARLVFVCRHRSSNEAKDRAERPFALASLRLMQRDGTTTPDAQHCLCVYKIDKHSNDIEASAACLDLPSKREELPEGAEHGLKAKNGSLSLVYKDQLVVATKLCSTKLTQREEILGVLKWHTHLNEGVLVQEGRLLRNALVQLLNVPSEELVKFLQDILDALFQILTQVKETEACYSERSFGVLVLDCLLRVISLVADHKYQHFQPVLHVYIDESFCDALAYERLISVMVWVISSANSGDAALKRLLVCMKCVESLLRFIVRSRQLRSALGDDSDRDFALLFEQLLERLVWLMTCSEHALTCQGSALKYLPHAVPHIIKVYPDIQLSLYLVRALEALPLGRLSKQRMCALLELVRGPLAAAPPARQALLPHLAATTRDLLRDKAEWDRSAAHKYRSVGKVARLLGADTARLQDQTNQQQIVELCVETLGEVMSLLAREDVGPVEADVGELARGLLPTVLRTAASMLKDRKSTVSTSDMGSSSPDDVLLRGIVSVLLDMIRQMSEHQYTMVVRALEAENTAGSGSLVADALSLFLAILQRPVYRPHWADMLHLQHHVMLHALRLLSTTILERLRSSEEAEDEAPRLVHTLSETWFAAGAALATSAPLQLETLPVARKQRLSALYGDIRRAVAHCLRHMWNELGDHKRSFIPQLVGPFLEVSFLCDEEVRNTTIPVFFDMMQTEYSHSIAGDCNDSPLRELESEMIDKVDVLVERGYGDSAWRARFVSLCGVLCGAAPPGLRGAAAALVAAAARQLDTLLQYRSAASRSSLPHRMHLTTRVLHFYQQIERPHMYIRYVHKLAKMHSSAQQWTEAGLSLLLHAKLLSWSNEPLPPRLRHPDPAHHNLLSHRELKEFLYIKIVERLKLGHQWELAIEIVKQLVLVYEEEALGYAPLAMLHSQLAELYDSILKTLRSHPGYFRVIYHGKGFPELLRMPHGYIYRGNEYEQLQQFIDRILDEWPDAHVLPKLDPPGKDITESDGQYLQINAVEPVISDKLKRSSGKPVADQILSYYKHNNVDKFIFNRPFHRAEESLDGSTDDLSKSKNMFATQWLERTELEISDKLPGILRWFPITSTRTYEVSPVVAAVESLRDKNSRLRSVLMEARSPAASLHPLSMMLAGILDAAVQGGIDNYERAFLTPAYETRHPQHAHHLAQLKDLIADQIPLLKLGLEVHGSRMSQDLKPLHSRLCKLFQDMQQHVHQRYGKKNCDLEVGSPEVQFRMPYRDSISSESGIASMNRLSDISTGNETAGSKSPGRFFGFSASTINPLSVIPTTKANRNSGSSITNRFGTLHSTPRRNKRQLRKSEVCNQASSGSQWYTSSTPNGSLNNSPAANNNNSPTTNNNTVVNNNADSPSSLRELTQEVSHTVLAKIAPRCKSIALSIRDLSRTTINLVTERPLRAEAERERRLSQRASLLTSSAPPSNRDSFGTTDSNQEEDDLKPPPIPQKEKKHQYRSMDLDAELNNNAELPLPPRYNYDTVAVLAPRGSFLYNSLSQRRNTTANDCKAPTPPPKKRNAQ